MIWQNWPVTSSCKWKKFEQNIMIFIFTLLSTAYSLCDIVFTSQELRGTFRPVIDEFGNRPVFSDGENFLFFKLVDGTPKWIIAIFTK